MKYTSLYQKYRPQTFEDIKGQDHIVKTLLSALKHNKVANAYIFAGPRGVGKTSTARVFAKALNCLKSNINPCNECENCKEITQGIFPDVIEIDAASNRGIDQIRELRENVKYAPLKGRKKVYIIDEFHMLTKEAFNALLKTLEEPPSHVVFILATTELDKIPATILSRCQKFIFRKLSIEEILEILEDICKKENVKYEKEALELIAKLSEGCIRDAESLLEQAILLTEGNLSVDKLKTYLSLFTHEDIEELLKLSLSSDLESLREKLNKYESLGYSSENLIKAILNYVSEKFKKEDFEKFSQDILLIIFETFSKAYKDLASHPYPYDLIYFTFVKISYFNDLISVKEFLSNLKVPANNLDENIKKNLKKLLPT